MLPGLHVLHLRGQVEHVQPLVERDAAAHLLDDLLLLAGVEQQVRGQHVAQHPGDVDLLADDPVEVLVRQPVPLSHELQRVRAADRLDAGGEVRAGVGVAGGRAEVDLHAADDGR